MTWASGYTSPPGWKQTRKRILTRDNNTCYICGQSGADQVDHIINVATGGTHDDTNLAAIHKYPCHADKTRAETRAARNVPPPPAPPSTRRRKEQHPGLKATPN